MSNPLNGRGRARESQIPQGESVGEFDSYQKASQLVNKLVANDFPPSLITIVGDDLKLSRLFARNLDLAELHSVVP